MYTYVTIIAGIVIIIGLMILDRLKKICATQEQQKELLQELVSNSNRSQTGLLPEMLAGYLSVMTEDQNQRYRQWLTGKEHEAFTFQEIDALDKKIKTVPDVKN